MYITLRPTVIYLWATCSHRIASFEFHKRRQLFIGRGYSITINECGQIIRTIAAVRSKMKIRTRVSDGEFGSEVL